MRKCPGRVCGRTAPVAPGWRAGRTGGHRSCWPYLRGPWPAGSSGPGAGSAPRRTSWHVRGGCRRDNRSPRWWPASGRRPDIRPASDRPRQQDGHRHEPGHLPNTGRPEGDRSGRGGRSIRRSLPRYSFLYSSSRPALRPAAGGGRPRPAQPQGRRGFSGSGCVSASGRPCCRGRALLVGDRSGSPRRRR
jgi:hypothetical protein